MNMNKYYIIQYIYVYISIYEKDSKFLNIIGNKWN